MFGGLLCRFGRHRWVDLDRTTKADGTGEIDWSEDNRRCREHRGDPLLRRCARKRCGRVESSAFTGRFSRAEHLERDRLVQEQQAA